MLTTHSMEEADALCTRIGIMVNGKLSSLGTPQQLKSMHGAGYRITVRLTAGDADTEDDTGGELCRVLQEKYADAGSGDSAEAGIAGTNPVQYVPTASSATLKVFNLAQDNISLGALFALLEERREDLNIRDYSVSQCTMEQVFTKFAQYQTDDVAAHAPNSSVQGGQGTGYTEGALASGILSAI